VPAGQAALAVRAGLVVRVGQAVPAVRAASVVRVGQAVLAVRAALLVLADLAALAVPAPLLGRVVPQERAAWGQAGAAERPSSRLAEASASAVRNDRGRLVI
jgi:hypothetical protein